MPNGWMFVVLVVGSVLAAVDKLTTWWGIVIVAIVSVITVMESWTSETISPADAQTDAFIVVPGAVAGLFLGFTIFDAWWGATLGCILGGLVMSFPAAAVQVLLERRF